MLVIDAAALLGRIAPRLVNRWGVRLADAEDEIGIGDGGLIIVRSQWSEECLRETNARFPAWYPMGIGDRISLGPLMSAGSRGCLLCAQRRRPASMPIGAAAALPLPCFIDDVLGNAMHRLVDRQLGTGPDHRSIIEISPDTLEVSPRQFLPDPTCPLCADLPLDSAERATIEVTSRAKPSATTFRVRDDHDILGSRYTDPKVGVVAGPTSHITTLLPAASARFGAPGSSPSISTSYGQAGDHRTAMMLAVLEGLERRAGMRPTGKQTVVHGTYGELRAHALDPRDLGLYSEEQYTLSGFPFIRFDENLPLDWVWGYSLLRNEPILVPETMAYFHSGTKGPRLVRETSSGCAVGSCLEEAVFHSLIEVMERDTVLRAWYSRPSVRQIAVATVPDEWIRFVVERIRWRCDYEVHLFELPSDVGLATFWAMAVESGSFSSRPHSLSAVGADPHPLRAVRSALRELAGHIDWTDDWGESSTRSRPAAMLRNPYLVGEVEDHLALYCHPDAFERFAFLFTDDVRLDWNSSCSSRNPWPDHLDLRDDLGEMLDRLQRCGLDAIVVDQTGEELRSADLVCVKTLVPGALPMTFGHAYRRTTGLPRLHGVASTTGDSAYAASTDDLNPHPHPFA